MNIFKTYHPIVNFIYFTSAVIFSVIYTHPFYILISFVFSTLYLIMLKGRFIKYAAAAVLLIAFFYPAVNHGGITVITYLPDGNPFTLESVIYGFAFAFSAVSALLWFFCCTRVLTTDKLMCVFGSFHPSASLMLSLTLRFIPRFAERMKKAFTAQRGICRNVGKVNFFKRIRLWMSVFSATVTWATENTIDISASMTSRGYGVAKRTSFAPYRYKKADSSVTATILLLVLCIITASANIQYFPYIKFNSAKSAGVIAYFIFCAFPLLIEMLERNRKKVVIPQENQDRLTF